MTDHVLLGRSRISVSRLAFGTLTVSPLQKGFSVARAQALFIAAYEMGITFFDTAQLYQTYKPLKGLLKRHPEAVIATKSYAYNLSSARDAFDEARRELDKDVIDIFLLHEQESRETMRGHREAFDFYLSMKACGLIRAVGISTHCIDAVDFAPRYPGLDILHPLINLTGVGIRNGTRDKMAAAIGRAHDAGIGVYSMKALGGGHLYRTPGDAFTYLSELGSIDAIAVGMQSEEEMAVNIALLDGCQPDDASLLACQNRDRHLLFQDWCSGCGQCVRRCTQTAIRLQEGKAVVDHDRCLLCGYCATVCDHYCIKVV